MDADDAPLVTLLEEGGNERQFRLHDAFDLEGASYYLVEDAADPEQVLLLKESVEGLEAVAGPELDRVMVELEAQEATEE